MTKSEIRRTMRTRRAAVTPEERAEASADLCDRLLHRPEVIAVRARKGCVAVYLATPQELDLSDFIIAIISSGVRVAAPRWNGSGYDLALLGGLSPDTLRQGPMGVMEPLAEETVPAHAVDVWIVPGLAFSRDGARLGYGGGWYDRFLAAARPDATSLGVAYRFQLCDALPREPHDRPLTGIVEA